MKTMTKLGGLKIVEKKAEQKKEVRLPSPAPSGSAGQKLAQAAYIVRKTLGAGLGREVYRQCLAEELRAAGLSVTEDVPFPVKYKNMNIARAFTADIVMGDAIVVLHCDSGDADCREEAATYLRHSGRADAYMVNFSAKDPRRMIAKASSRAASLSFGSADKGKVN